MKYTNTQQKTVFIVYTVMIAMVVAACGGGGGGDSQTTGSDPSQLTFTISGTIQAPDNALIDSDVNDPSAIYAPNDSFIDAQELPNPVILGGYVNSPNTGASGRSQLSGDESDFFRLSLTAGQSILLFIASSPAEVDLDLFLYDDLRTQIDAAMGTGSQESLITPADGEYFIEVRAIDSASNYNLSIGQITPAGMVDTLRLSDEFVAGEAIVILEDSASSAMISSSLTGPPRVLGMQVKAGAAGRGILLGFDGETGRQQAFRTLGIRQSPANGRIYQAADPDQNYKMDTLRIIKSMRRRFGVRSAQPNFIRKTQAIPNDPLYNRQWHYPLINLPQSWDVSTGSNDVIVAVIDTGVLSNHPDLANRLTVDGYDFISDPSRALDGDGLDPDPDDPGDGRPGGSSFHGTHVAGIIAAETNNDTGVSGVAWFTRIMPLRALGQGGGTDFDILQAVRYAAGLENDSGTLPAQRADIINLSLGGSNFSQIAQDIFTEVRAEGVITIAAAGNGASSVPFYPAAYDGVISVGAVDIDKDLTWYSNFGTTIDVVAPGGDNFADVNIDGLPDGILSTCGNDSTGVVEFVYCFFQGTSMAAPHMAGAAALMKAIYPGLTPDELDILLVNNSITEDIGATGRDNQFGSGLIDAFGAIVEAQDLAGGGVVPLTLIVTPAALNFGPQSTAILSVERAGGNTGDRLLIRAVTSNVTWLEISEDLTDADQLGTYRIVINRDQLAPGIYTGNITVDAENAGVSDIEVPVSMQVVTPILGGNAGFHYVLLVDSETLTVQDQENVPFRPGGYTYSFTNVPAGNYKIFGGTDSNNDALLGDPGEAYGAYLTLDQPVSISVSDDQSGLDFNTNFEISFPSRLDAGVVPVRPMLKRSETKKVIK